MNARHHTPGLDHYWLPFTPNRYFNEHPKLLASAKGAYYTTDDGRDLFDCLSGLWCCPLGHAHPKIVEALTRQAQTLDYSPAFQFCNPVTLALADRVAAMAPAELTRVFFTNSGSEAVDLDPIPGKPGLRGLKVFERGLEEGLLLRLAGDSIAVGPPFISTDDEIEQMGAGLRRSIQYVMQQGNA